MQGLADPAQGGLPTQAERIYFAEHNSYADLGELAASGTLSLPRAEGDGHIYSVEATPEGFTATARYIR